LKKEKTGKARRAAKSIPNEKNSPIPSDTQGSYTGSGNNGKAPEQDADDLQTRSLWHKVFMALLFLPISIIMMI